eukprot:scaffold31536_cov73-Skeletonema_marinoi.AAC.1
MSDLLINGIGSPVKGSLKEDVCAAAKDASPSRIVAATDMLLPRLEVNYNTYIHGPSEAAGRAEPQRKSKGPFGGCAAITVVKSSNQSQRCVSNHHGKQLGNSSNKRGSGTIASHIKNGTVINSCTDANEETEAATNSSDDGGV